MQPLVYLDLDGVMVDLLGGLSERIRQELPRNNPKVFTKAFREYTHSLNSLETVKFWESLPPTKDFNRIWNFFKSHKPLILSSVSNNQAAVCGKELWCKKHLGIEPERVFCTFSSKDKKYYASPRSILIDDFDENIADFMSAGGHAIHHTDTDNTFVQFSEFLSSNKWKPA